MKILIIGGAGFLGANLVRRCLAEPGARVTVMDSLDPHLHATTQNLQEVWPQIRFVRGDMRDETLLAEIVQGQDVIWGVHDQRTPEGLRGAQRSGSLVAFGHVMKQGQQAGNPSVPAQ